MKAFALFCLALIMIGCATIPPIQTASGKPEITIPNTTKEKVANEIINTASNNGFTLISSTPNLITFDKPADGALAYFYGSSYNRVPNHRLQFQLTDVPDGVRVLVDLFIVTNPGTGFEKLENRNSSKDAHELYKGLENLKTRLIN